MKTKLHHTIQLLRSGYMKDICQKTRWLYQYIRKYWLSIVIYTLLGLSGVATSLISSVISKDLIDIITGHQTGMLIRTFCLYIGFAIGSLLITQLTTYVSTIISLKVDNEVKSDIFEKMMLTDWEKITNYHTGDLLTRWNTDASVLSSGILDWLPNLIINICRFVAALAIVIYYDPTFALFSLLGIPVSLALSHSMMNRMAQNNRRSAAMSAKMSGFNQETFANIQIIKAFDLISLYTARLKQLQQEYLTMRRDFQKLNIVTSLILSTTALIVSYSCYGWGIYRVWSGAISYGTMTMFLTLSGMLTGALNSLIALVPTAISITTSADRLMDIMEMPKEDDTYRQEITNFAKKQQPYGIAVSVQNMSYTYHTGKTVFQNASFQAHPHEIVALVGPSGEGKTTLLRILLALLRPQSGSLRLCSDHSAESWPVCPAARQLFSYVPQGNSMFSGTIAENLRSVKPSATSEEIINCLKQAAAWDFVSALPHGIDSRIGEKGTGISEGQAQRLAIARALLRHSPILLLDEATSALDEETEAAILRNIMQDTYPRTCILTTHRPAVLNICSRIYTIKNGQCIEQ